MDMKTCNFREIVRVIAEDMKHIRNRQRMFVARILIERFPEFLNLKLYIPKEITLERQHSTATAQKSEVMTLPVLLKDEKKCSNCVDVLNHLEERTREVYYARGLCKDPKSSTTNPLLVVRARS